MVWLLVHKLTNELTEEIITLKKHHVYVSFKETVPLVSKNFASCHNKEDILKVLSSEMDPAESRLIP